MIINVGAAAIFDSEGKILCCKRNNTPPHSKKWEFPGGKLEKDESVTECIVREIKEELNLEIIPINEIISITHKYPHANVCINLWHCVISEESDAMKLHCHSDKKWLYASEMIGLDWLDADVEIVRFLQKYNINSS